MYRRSLFLLITALIFSSYAMGPQTLHKTPVQYFSGISGQDYNKKLTERPDWVRLLNATSKLPPEIIQEHIFKQSPFKDFTSLDYLAYYDALNDFRKDLMNALGRSNEKKFTDFIEEVIDSKTGKPFKRFKGDNLMASMQAIAKKNVARILNCTIDGLDNGTCQPYKDSSDPKISPEDKEQKIDLKHQWWVKDQWVSLWPMLEIFNKQLSTLGSTWKVTFKQDLYSAALNMARENFFYDLQSLNHKTFGYTIDYYNFSKGPITKLYNKLFPEPQHQTIIKHIKNEYYSMEEKKFVIELPSSEFSLTEFNKKRFIRQLENDPVIFENYTIALDKPENTQRIELTLRNK